MFLRWNFQMKWRKILFSYKDPNLFYYWHRGCYPYWSTFEKRQEVIMEVWSGAISPSWVQHNGLTHYARRMFTWEAPKYLLIAGRHPLYIGGSSWTGIKGPTSPFTCRHNGFTITVAIYLPTPTSPCLLVDNPCEFWVSSHFAIILKFLWVTDFS